MKASTIQGKWRPILVGGKPFLERVLFQDGSVMATRRPTTMKEYLERRAVYDLHREGERDSCYRPVDR